MYEALLKDVWGLSTISLRTCSQSFAFLGTGQSRVSGPFQTSTVGDQTFDEVRVPPLDAVSGLF